MDPRIDRLRGLLAIGVMLGHAIELAHLSASQPSGTFFSIAMAARPYLGFICVVGFIVLSGYCIARSTMKGFALGQYTVMRVTRLYPLLIAAVLLTGILEWAALDSPFRPDMWTPGRDVRQFVIALAGFSGFHGTFGALAPAYTISFELLFYAVWGLAMTTVRGSGRQAVLAAAGIAVMLILAGGWLRASMGWFAAFLPALCIAVFPGWVLGAALALFQDKVARAARVLPIWALWILFAAVYQWFLSTFNLPTSFTARYAVTVAYLTIVSGLIVTMVAAWLARPPVRRSSDAWLGEISYPLFLIHGPAIIGVQFALNAWHVELTFGATLALLIAAAFAGAMGMLIAVERPVMAWRRRIRQPARRASVVAQGDKRIHA